jgi:hypothetical protein
MRDEFMGMLEFCQSLFVWITTSFKTSVGMSSHCQSIEQLLCLYALPGVLAMFINMALHGGKGMFGYLIGRLGRAVLTQVVSD